MNRTSLRLLLPVAAILVMTAAGACTGPPPATSPVGMWQVSRYMNAGDGLSAPIAGWPITLTVNADGQLGGKACNHYGAPWSVNGAAITIGNITSTVMACVGSGGDVMRQEGDYFTALRAARTWRVEGDTLTLTHPRGTSVVAVRVPVT